MGHVPTALFDSASYTYQSSLPCYQTHHEYSQSSSKKSVRILIVPLEIADLVLGRKRSLSKVGASAQPSVPFSKCSCRRRTSHSNGTQARKGLACKAILCPVFHPRHLTDLEDEERQRIKGSHHSVAGSFQFVSTCPLFYARKLTIISDANDGSDLLVEVYRKHRAGKDTLVGSLADTIGGVLGKLTDGGTQISMILHI